MKTLKPIDSLALARDLSVDDGLRGELDARFTIEVEGEKWHCYTVAVGDREFTCCCDKGTANFQVDTYGTRHTCELFDWERDA